MATAKELCLMLDYEARGALRQAVKKGYINRVHGKKWGVYLLQGLGLIEVTKTTKTMYRYEPTQLGLEVAGYLPTRDSEHEYVMLDKPLVYADGTTIAKSLVVNYGYVRDYQPVIEAVRRNQATSTPTQTQSDNFAQAVKLLDDIQDKVSRGKSARAIKRDNLPEIVSLLDQVKTLIEED